MDVMLVRLSEMVVFTEVVYANKTMYDGIFES